MLAQYCRHALQHEDGSSAGSSGFGVMGCFPVCCCCVFKITVFIISMYICNKAGSFKFYLENKTLTEYT